MSKDRDNLFTKKKEHLVNILSEMEDVVVAMSGGVDSLLLAKVAYDTLGERSLAVTADSPSLPRRELDDIVSIVKNFGIPHKVLVTSELNNPEYIENTSNRCYFCKDELFDHLDQIRSETNAKWVLFGENVDDQSDHRPGSIAAIEHGVRAPLKEAGFTKNEIRLYAKSLNLPVWNKPASACLASRIPYGQPITAEKLAQVEHAEYFLHEMGIENCRVRHHGEVARIEVDQKDLEKIISHAQKIYEAFKDIGFMYTAVDLAGYRRGSMNEALIQVSEIK